MPETVLYVVGDVHLDGGRNAFVSFLAELAGRPPARLVILGDLFEYWLDTEASVERNAAACAALRSLAAAGWRLDLILGNREMAAGRRLPAATACRIAWPGLRLQLGPRRIHIVHGDRLCPEPAQRLLTVQVRSFWFTAIRGMVPDWLLERVALGLRRLSRRRRLRRRRRLARGQPVIGFDPLRVRRAAGDAGTLIAGHIHECWRRQVGPNVVYLVGDWDARRGSWIEGRADGQLLQVRRVFA